MTAAAAAALLLFTAAAPQLSEIAPAQILFVVLAPPAAHADISGAELFNAAEPIFRGSAHVELTSTERAGISSSDFAACPVETRATCWVKLALETARVLIIASLQPDPGGRAIALAAFDLRASAMIIGGGSEEEVERAIWAAAIRVPREKIARATMTAYLRRAAGGELGDLLARIAPKTQLGSIRAEHLVRGAELALDDKTIGTATSTTALIAHVTAGVRRLRMENAGAGAIERVVEVQSGAEASADFLVVEPELFSRPVKLGLGGVAVLAGAGLLTAGVLSNGASAICVHRAGAASSCDGAPAFEPGPGGVNVAAGARGAPATLVIGAGVLALGVTWSIGQWVFDDDAPWWSAIAGIAAGLTASSLTYALSN